MKDALFSFLKSKTFKALLAVVATALGAYASQGCGADPAKVVNAAECLVPVVFEAPPADAGLE